MFHINLWNLNVHIVFFSRMTSLKDEVQRSEMICMLAVPAAMSAHDLLQFTAPVRYLQC